MKKVQMEQYEPGDHVMVTNGYHKGKVGIVVSHKTPTASVEYKLAGVTYDEDSDDDDYWDDDDDYYGDYESSPIKFLKHISKQEYETTLKKLKILTVPGLPVSVKFYGKNLIIGDNVITPVNAKKLVEFINTHTKTKGKKK
jgi:hypothetical protein